MRSGGRQADELHPESLTDGGVTGEGAARASISTVGRPGIVMARKPAGGRTVEMSKATVDVPVSQITDNPGFLRPR